MAVQVGSWVPLVAVHDYPTGRCKRRANSSVTILQPLRRTLDRGSEGSIVPGRGRDSRFNFIARVWVAGRCRRGCSLQS